MSPVPAPVILLPTGRATRMGCHQLLQAIPPHPFPLPMYGSHYIHVQILCYNVCVMNKDHCNHHPQIKLMCKFELETTLLHVTLDHMVTERLLSLCAECVVDFHCIYKSERLHIQEDMYPNVVTENKSTLDNTQSNELGPMT